MKIEIKTKVKKKDEKVYDLEKQETFLIEYGKTFEREINFDMNTSQMNNILNQTANPLNNYQMTSSSFLDNQNPPATYVFYLPLPNEARIYHVTYTELHPLENARLLNNSINLSHILDHQFPHHYNVQSLIQQQIQQQVQQVQSVQSVHVVQQVHSVRLPSPQSRIAVRYLLLARQSGL